MAITVRTAGTLGTGTSSVTCSQPTGTSTGDFLVAFILDHATSGTSAAPTGWTNKANTSGTNGRFQVFTAEVGQGGLTGTSWGFTGLTTRSAGVILAFVGVDSGNPISGTISMRSNASGTTGTTAVTPTIAGCMIVAGFGAMASGSTWSAEACATNPTTLTEQSDNANSSFCSIATATASQTGAAGSTGASSATMATAGVNCGALLALVPAKIHARRTLSKWGTRMGTRSSGYRR